VSSYDFIVDNIRFSYSSTSTFDNCAYSFKLSYVTPKERENNFFAEYGTLIHNCFEKFFQGKLDSYELLEYYLKEYDSVIKSKALTPSMEDNYKEQGALFFSKFDFDKSKYEVILVEDKIDFEIGNIKAVAKPDLVLKRVSDGKNILFDYKTAIPFKTDYRTGNTCKLAY